jgi:hypothetical protein
MYTFLQKSASSTENIFPTKLATMDATSKFEFYDLSRNNMIFSYKLEF